MKARVAIPLSLNVLLVATLAAIAISTHPVPAQQLSHPSITTFSKDVAPIVFGNCAVCHRPGGSAPFSLLQYSDVTKHGRQIAQVTKSRYMPPWLPDPGYGRFFGERILSDAQIGTLQQWVANGMPEGSAADMPPLPEFHEEWQLGRPDLIVQVPQPYVLLAGGNTESWPRFVLPVPSIETHYVRGIEIHPGDPKVVHHCYIVTDRSDVIHITNGEVYETGSTGMERRFASSGSELDSRFLTWRPGTPPYLEPDGATWRLDKNTDLILTLHLLASGKSESIQPTVGFYFSDQAPTKFPMILHLEHDRGIDIPAGTGSYIVSDELELPVDVKILSVLPHAHYLCKDMQAYATLPDGTRRWLIWIKRWDFDWQGVFRYVDPVTLPKGSVISFRYTYDNSADNPLNPNSPPKRVVGGPRSTDEMADLWLEALPDRKEDLPTIEVALMKRKISKYPDEIDGYSDLGTALHSMGRNKEAIAPLREAARLQPENAQVQNNLGTVRASLGEFSEASTYFREALRLRPDYFAACMNLASALRLSGNLAEAITYYAEALRMKPDSADAHDKLGSVYAQEGDLAQALDQFEEALRIEPNNAAALDHVSRAKQMLGSPPR
jgi:Flp pilus assembly protein TadD/mono/diheme cytochrome c family protein